MDSKKARDLVDTDNLKIQLQEIAAQVKNGETATVTFTYMYGSPIEITFKRDEKGSLTIEEPNLTYASEDERLILDEAVTKSIDFIVKNQPPVFNDPQTKTESKSLLSMHSIFAKRPVHRPDTTVHLAPPPPKLKP